MPAEQTVVVLPDVIAGVEADWHAWNATMLAEIPDSFGETYSGGDLADHV